MIARVGLAGGVRTEITAGAAEATAVEEADADCAAAGEGLSLRSGMGRGGGEGRAGDGTGGVAEAAAAAGLAEGVAIGVDVTGRLRPELTKTSFCARALALAEMDARRTACERAEAASERRGDAGGVRLRPGPCSER